jgi:hypothetical protein
LVLRGRQDIERDYWIRIIRKFQPYYPDSNDNIAKQYYGGVKKEKTGEDEALRVIRVWVAARQNRHFDEEFLHSFYGKIHVTSDDDNLVSPDETRAPILIPWFTVRIVEVD